MLGSAFIFVRSEESQISKITKSRISIRGTELIFQIIEHVHTTPKVVENEFKLALIITNLDLNLSLNQITRYFEVFGAILILTPNIDEVTQSHGGSCRIIYGEDSVVESLVDPTSPNHILAGLELGLHCIKVEAGAVLNLVTDQKKQKQQANVSRKISLVEE